MTDDTLLPFNLPAVCRKKLTVDFEGGNQSSNCGALLLREAERDVGVCRRLAETMPDRRAPDHIQHQMVEMVTARVTAIACGHEDAIDHNDLRHDPVMKVAVGRCPESGAPLGSQSTISRLENAPSKTDAARLTWLAPTAARIILVTGLRAMNQRRILALNARTRDQRSRGNHAAFAFIRASRDRRLSRKAKRARCIGVVRPRSHAEAATWRGLSWQVGACRGATRHAVMCRDYSAMMLRPRSHADVVQKNAGHCPA
jgi:hypothetical protein